MTMKCVYSMSGYKVCSRSAKWQSRPLQHYYTMSLLESILSSVWCNGLWVWLGRHHCHGLASRHCGQRRRRCSMAHQIERAACCLGSQMTPTMSTLTMSAWHFPNLHFSWNPWHRGSIRLNKHRDTSKGRYCHFRPFAKTKAKLVFPQGDVFQFWSTQPYD